MQTKNFYILSCVLLASCSSFKEKIGLTQHTPNEFETVQNDPLEIPSHLDLYNPDSQYKSKKTTSDKAQSILVAAPLKRSNVKDNRAELLLLDKIKSTQPDKDIRQKIDKDNQAEPTLNEKIQRALTFWKKHHKKGKVIDPQKEAENLQSESTLGET